MTVRETALRSVAPVPDPQERGVGSVFDFGVGWRQYMRRLGWSSLTMILIRAKGVITLPLALLILGASGYGTVTVAMTLGTVIATVTVLNIPDGVTRLIIGSDPLQAEARLARVRLVSVAAALALLAAAGLAAAGFEASIAAWACVTAAASIVFKAGIVHMQYFQLARRLARYTVISQYVASAVALPAALWLGPSGFLAANAAVLTLAAIPAWLSLHAHRGVVEDPGFWAPAVRLSLQMLPASVAEWALFSIDAVLVYDILGSGPAGAYSAAYSISALGLVIPTALATVWPQTAQRLLQAGGWRWHDAQRRLMAVVGISGLALVLGAIAFKPLLGAILHQPVYSALPSSVVWVMVGFAAFGLARLFEGSLYAAGRPSAIVCGYGVATGVNVGLNLLWIPQYGILGAAYATAAGYAALAIVLFLAMSLRTPSTEEACAS